MVATVPTGSPGLSVATSVRPMSNVFKLKLAIIIRM